MGHINMPPQVHDIIKNLENRIHKLELFNRNAKMFAMRQGAVNITPVANTPTNVTVTLNPSPFTLSPLIYVSVNTTVPGTTVTGFSYAASSTVANSNNGYTTTFDIYVTRINNTSTAMRWLAIQSTATTV